MKNLIITFLISLLSLPVLAQNTLKLAIAGLSHGHVDWVFNRKDKKDVELVGIYETNPELINRYAERYDIDRDRKSTRLNSSHVKTSYAVFCLKKKKKTNTTK